MTQRLTPEREALIRKSCGLTKLLTSNNFAASELLDEIDALRAELAGAEERGAARERAAIAEVAEPLFGELEYSDTEAHGGEHFDDDCSVCRAIETLKERLSPAEPVGDHVRTGTTPPDAGEPQP